MTNELTPSEQAPEATGTKLVQMRLLPKTLKRIENLQKMTGNPNRTQLVSGSIQLAEAILHDLKSGGKVYVEKPDGTREVLRFVGF